MGDTRKRFLNRGGLKKSIHNPEKINPPQQTRIIEKYGLKTIPHDNNATTFMNRIWEESQNWKTTFNKRENVDNMIHIKNMAIDRATDRYIDYCLTNYFDNKHKRKPILSNTQKRSLARLRKNEKYLISDSDKNLGPVLVSHEYFDNLTMKTLQDKNSFKIFKHTVSKQQILNEGLEIMMKHFDYINNNIKNNKERGLTKREQGKIVEHAKKCKKIANMIILLKMHKTPIKPRPVVRQSNDVQNKPIQRFITKVLQCMVTFIHALLMKKLKTNDTILVENSLEVIESIEKLQSKDDLAIITLDVEKLYPSLTFAQIIMVIIIAGILMKLSRNYILSICILVRLLYKTAFVGYKQTFAYQHNGSTMGNNESPAVANLVLLVYELSKWFIIQKFELYKRYMDDILIVCKRKNLNTLLPLIMFCLYPNNLKLKIDKVTLRSFGRVANFLDLQVFILCIDGIFYAAVRIYLKPDQNSLHLHKLSNHPRHSKSGFISSEDLRGITHCTFESDYIEFKRNICERLMQVIQRRVNIKIIIVQFFIDFCVYFISFYCFINNKIIICFCNLSF